MADETQGTPHYVKPPEKAFVFWMAEIEAAKKREEAFRKTGQEILALYEGDKSQPAPFNILYSNTETILPALYSRTPRPQVDRRFKDADPLSKAASQAATRMLEYLIDTNMDDYDAPHEAWKQSVLSACLPGRGVLRVKYDAQMTGDTVQYETVCTKSWSWKRFYHGYARTWSAVPWVAYEYEIDKAEALEKFEEAVVETLVFTGSDRSDREDQDAQDKHKGEKKTVRIYEIWDKEAKKVRFFAATHVEGALKEEDDPLGLTGFFDCPRPLMLVDKHDSLVPTALYTLYKTQAQELNIITKRIMGLTKALKARGLYAGDVSADLKRLMDAEENELVPADVSASLAAEKGLQNAIWMLPLDQWIIVLRELMGVREQCKQTIYEITGIGDIMRGATKASETLGAQELKSQWGTLRLKSKQAEVQRYVRDTIRLMLDIAATKFSESTWAQMTGLPYLTEQQAAQAQMIAQAAQQSGQPIPPEVQQQLQSPTWPAVLGLLKNDLQRAYKVDIETNSTVEPEAAEDRKSLMELLMACGQFLNGVAPLVVSGSLPFEAAKQMLLMITRMYRQGAQVEDAIQAMQPPKPPDEDGAEQVQKEKEMASKELEMQKKMAEGDIKMKVLDAEMQHKQREMDLQMREAQLGVDQQVFGMEQQAAEQTITSRAQMEGNKLDFQQKKAQLENGKFKTENVANQKVDQGMQKGLGAMQDMVQQLVQTVNTQSQQTQKIVETLSKALTAPRIKTAIRGKDGRLEGVEEKVA